MSYVNQLPYGLPKELRARNLGLWLDHESSAALDRGRAALKALGTPTFSQADYVRRVVKWAAEAFEMEINEKESNAA